MLRSSSPYAALLPRAPRGTAPLTCAADLGRDDLESVPITPADVLAGDPVARGTRLSDSADGRLSTNIWDCTAGTFRWHFSVDEIIHVLDGHVRVHDQDGGVHELRAGDVAHFPLGTTTVWEIDEYVRKLAILRSPSRRLHARVWRKLKRTLARGHGALLPLPLGLASAEQTLALLPV